MHLLQAIVAGLVIMILVLGFFAFHVLFRRYVWPETYRKAEEEMQSTKKVQKKFNLPRTKTKD
ncbi:MAG: hypothetical protein QMD05_03025 [Candidatus Brocadiaceae bacterium]|nr:hypothetical protein [Candidatus Brocadiaceae bacterium]